ncbi:MAG TPA: hypothetical protein VGH19_08560 [Verrucomicrobiae bacterium]
MRFRYLRDPLFLLAVVLYAANRWYLKPHFGGAFLNGYFNDLLLIPAALPPILWLHWRCGWRTHHAPPSFLEITAHLALWAFLAEVIGPHLKATSVSDWADVAAYAAGALLAFLIWKHLPATNKPEAA